MDITPTKAASWLGPQAATRGKIGSTVKAGVEV